VLVGMTTGLFGAALFAAREPAALVLLAAVWGLASGFQSAGGQSFMLAAVSRERLGIATAAYFLAGTLSGSLGAFAGGLLAERLGFATVAAGAAGAALAAVLLAAVFLPSMGRDESAAGKAGRVRWTAAYGDLLRRTDVRQLCAVRFLPTAAWGIASLAVPLLVFRHSASVATVGLYGTVSLAAASGAQLLTGRLVDHLSARDVPARRLVAPLAVAILASALACALVSTAGWVPGLFVAGTAWAMSAWALSTTMPPIIRGIGQGRDDGRLVALTHLVWSAGMLSGSFLAGALVDVHPAAPFGVAAACLALTAWIGWRFGQSGTTG
jgi:MFS family permease